MRDKCILVTGSSSGIGSSITRKLLQVGARVIGIARNHEKNLIENDNYIKYTIDVSNLSNLEKSIKVILKKHPDLNVLISNAGYGDFGPLDNFSVEKINHFITTNLTSHLIISKFLLSHFKIKKIGDIIFIGSEAGLSGEKNGSLYCTAKFGLRGLSQSLRKDVSGKNIRISIINPGMVKTNFFDKLKFYPGENKENSISLDDINDAIFTILSLQRNTVVEEINLSPAQKVIRFLSWNKIVLNHKSLVNYSIIVTARLFFDHAMLLEPTTAGFSFP